MKTNKRTYEALLIIGLIFLNLAMFLIIPRIYYSNNMEALFFCSSILEVAFPICLVLSLIILVVLKGIREFSVNKNKSGISIILKIVLCILLILPYGFMNSGLLADEESIKYTNVYGDVTNEYHYSDIQKCVMLNDRQGITYFLYFKNNRMIKIDEGANILYPRFRNDKNLVYFNKIIYKHCTPIWEESIRAMDKSQFENLEIYKYFEKLEKDSLSKNKTKN